MFFEPPEQDSHPTKTLQNNPRRKRKKKFTNQKKQIGQRDLHRRKNCRFNTTMSSWAETFTTAATWQLKHQVAYWKSKAVALEYENRILHDIIKKNCIKTCSNNLSTTELEQCSIKSESESEIDVNDDCEENEDLEVSEEFIQFLRANAKYKEDAKRERERLRAKTEEENLIETEETQETDSCEQLKELYGKDWQRIAALEMSMKCNFINECDKEKPMYWPNIPFNFNFS